LSDIIGEERLRPTEGVTHTHTGGQVKRGPHTYMVEKRDSHIHNLNRSKPGLLIETAGGFQRSDIARISVRRLS